ncbi:hypothetical protein BO86DRAFT_354770 [Aspergillus japonicus CBS 114.51]|uniref:Autophagy-related protein 14 n=2 Tax=Aspergillus TaxID=5052 RepID=A0A2V5GVA4_ASPV1|nr:hypothetical protein BO86DRAFT_354770 [Aspergillus japonicus CBS 114.51]PYI14951.1 hypothetical protein BO99DRAFT_406310 [Aspergillus violaceofuscus CBS 115571]RAH85880.1 hypothetical protein BO86DRAFT_354770 [Aspergillus japonicus CBS 114.51]
MSCHICSRPPTSNLRCICPTCARNRLYQLRIEYSKLLLEKESIKQQIEAEVLLSKLSEGLTEEKSIFHVCLDGVSSSWVSRRIVEKEAGSSAKTTVLASHIEGLVSDIREKRLEISRRRVSLARRQSDAESAKYQLFERETAILASIQNNIKRIDHLWHSLHSKTTEARIFLCREAANLYNLRQGLKRVDGVVQETYTIGGLHLVDLRHMNGVSPAHISTALAYIAQLLVLISHYLSLRLPAEITLPHRNYPLPTIFAPSASYLLRDVGSKLPSAQQPSPDSIEPQRPDSHRMSRPRPLSIGKSLPRLAKEDPGTYALFLEGATLLAWNVAWLCRTQGLNSMSDSWEEICDMGKNLWQLLVAPPAQQSTLMRAFAGRDIHVKVKTSKVSPKTSIQRTVSFPMLGHYSHGTVHSFLGAAEGAEFMRTWRLPSPTRVIDKLKSTLMGELASAEWELLERRELEDIIHDRSSSVSQSSSTIPASTCKTGSVNADAVSESHDLEISSGAGSTSRLKGVNGWTKLRSR